MTINPEIRRLLGSVEPPVRSEPPGPRTASWPIAKGEVDQPTLDRLIQERNLADGECVVLERSISERPSSPTETLDSFVVAQGRRADAVAGRHGGSERAGHQEVCGTSRPLGPARSHARVFRSDGNEETILYRGDRVRDDDHLLLRWRDSVNSVEHCETVTVANVPDRTRDSAPQNLQGRRADAPGRHEREALEAGRCGRAMGDPDAARQPPGPGSLARADGCTGRVAAGQGRQGPASRGSRSHRWSS